MSHDETQDHPTPNLGADDQREDLEFIRDLAKQQMRDFIWHSLPNQRSNESEFNSWYAFMDLLGFSPDEMSRLRGLLWSHNQASSTASMSIITQITCNDIDILILGACNSFGNKLDVPTLRMLKDHLKYHGREESPLSPSPQASGSPE